MHYRGQAIVIKNIDYRESDKLVAVFDQHKGKFQALAKGVKKPGSSLRPCIQPFCHSHLFVSKGKSLDVITQGQLLNFYGGIRDDLGRTVQAIYMMELLDKTLMDHVALPRLFQLTCQVLSTMDQQEVHPLLIRYYEQVLLSELGYRPILNQCVACQGTEHLAGWFSLTEGGLVCERCIQPEENMFKLQPDTLSLLRLLNSSPLQTVLRVKPSVSSCRQAELFLEKYLGYHLERKFNMKDTIRFIKRTML